MRIGAEPGMNRKEFLRERPSIRTEMKSPSGFR
jgi:hypothetical protein